MQSISATYTQKNKFSLLTASKSDITSLRNRKHSNPWLFTVSSEQKSVKTKQNTDIVYMTIILFASYS